MMIGGLWPRVATVACVLAGMLGSPRALESPGAAGPWVMDITFKHKVSGHDDKMYWSGEKKIEICVTIKMPNGAADCKPCITIEDGKKSPREATADLAAEIRRKCELTVTSAERTILVSGAAPVQNGSPDNPICHPKTCPKTKSDDDDKPYVYYYTYQP